jgi:ubiquinone/menaquinone biosynthesis C-methylase UbiE
MENMQRHFSAIASTYTGLRATDVEPLLHVTRTLRGRPCVRGADVGCGAGRYDLELFKRIDAELSLVCIDRNRKMLEQLTHCLRTEGICSFTAVRAAAESLPLPQDSVDCVFSFNAIHHFDLGRAREEWARVLKRRALLFAYTRLQSQNCTSIWGRFFPGFSQKETRLYHLDELTEAFDAVASIRLESVDYFSYQRTAALEELIDRARRRHYSTFCLYGPDEFQKSLRQFKHTLLRVFHDPSNITWCDEYVLLVGRRTAS